jgi:hypothetical protein
MFTPAFFRQIATLWDRYPHPTLRYFFTLLADIDLRRPHALAADILIKHYVDAGEGWNREMMLEMIENLREAGLIEKVGRVKYRPGPMAKKGLALWRVPSKWWLTHNDLKWMVGEQDEWMGREALFTPASTQPTQTIQPTQPTQEEATSSPPPSQPSPQP